MLEFKYVKENIQNIQKLIVIPPIREFETDRLKKSLRLSRIREYEHEELVIKDGEEDSCLYFLLAGKVRLEKEKGDVEVIDNIGEIFGEMKALQGLVRSGAVRCQGKAVFLAVNTPPLINRLSSDDAADILLLLYRIFMEFIAIRLRLINGEVVRTKKEIELLKKK
jgi:CRP-like cAMP-binding protein